MTASIPDSERYRLIVVELDDVVPRRRADRPNLYVGVTKQTRTERYGQIARQRGPSWIRGHVLQLRADLTRNYGPTTSSDVRRQKRRLVSRLICRGYTVNRDTRVWHLYVVGLDATAIDDPGAGWVYVGETSKDPLVRLEEHLSGARNRRGRLYSNVVRDHGVALRTDLMDDLATYYTAKDAKAAERELAEMLRQQGYEVEGGH